MTKQEFMVVKGGELFFSPTTTADKVYKLGEHIPAMAKIAYPTWAGSRQEWYFCEPSLELRLNPSWKEKMKKILNSLNPETDKGKLLVNDLLSSIDRFPKA